MMADLPARRIVMRKKKRVSRKATTPRHKATEEPKSNGRDGDSPEFIIALGTGAESDPEAVIVSPPAVREEGLLRAIRVGLGVKAPDERLNQVLVDQMLDLG